MCQSNGLGVLGAGEYAAENDSSTPDVTRYFAQRTPSHESDERACYSKANTKEINGRDAFDKVVNDDK